MQVQTRRRPPSLDHETAPAPGRPARAPKKSATSSAKRVRRKDPLWARLTVVFGAVLMMVSGGTIVGSKALIGQATSSISEADLLGGAGKAATGGTNLDGPIDMLLLGVDHRKVWAANDTRADTIIILHVPATHDQAYLISIPRDTEVRIPSFAKSNYPGGVGKANEAFYRGAQGSGGWAGGAQLTAQAIKGLTGISFDGAAIIDFSGFKSVIDNLGGVRMCVDQEVASIHMFMVDGKPMYETQARKLGRKDQPVTYKKGCREMEGWEALDYSRQRYGLKNGDYDRQRHQQQLIKAMAKKAVDGGAMTNPLKINALIKAAGKAFTLDTGGTPIADFIFTLKGVAANDLVLLRTNGGTFAGNGSGNEALNPISQEMFEAVKEDRLAEFILANPAVVANEK